MPTFAAQYATIVAGAVYYFVITADTAGVTDFTITPAVLVLDSPERPSVRTEYRHLDGGPDLSVGGGAAVRFVLDPDVTAAMVPGYWQVGYGVKTIGADLESTDPKLVQVLLLRAGALPLT